MKKIIFLNHKQKNCGVYHYGYRTCEIISKSKKYSFIYYEVDTEKEYFDIINDEKPDGIIYNLYYPYTMDWLNVNNMGMFKHLKHYKLCHEEPATLLFNYFINDPIQRGPIGFPLNTRPIFENLKLEYVENEIPVIGSFGFGFDLKGFDHLCETVNREFDEAIIKLNITFSHYSDPNGADSMRISEICRKKITKENIKLEIDHNFKTTEEILNFLASNDINVFLYNINHSRSGFSSVIDYAMSVKRPIAITRSNMFRHIYDTNPSICIENNNLKQIMKNGSGVLDIYREKWSNENLIKEYEYIIEKTI